MEYRDTGIQGETERDISIVCFCSSAQNRQYREISCSSLAVPVCADREKLIRSKLLQWEDLRSSKSC